MCARVWCACLRPPPDERTNERTNEARASHSQARVKDNARRLSCPSSQECSELANLRQLNLLANSPLASKPLFAFVARKPAKQRSRSRGPNSGAHLARRRAQIKSSAGARDTDPWPSGRDIFLCFTRAKTLSLSCFAQSLQHQRQKKKKRTRKRKRKRKISPLDERIFRPTQSLQSSEAKRRRLCLCRH